MTRIGTVNKSELITIDNKTIIQLNVDLGAGDIVLAVLYQPYGINASPLIGDKVICHDINRKGKWVCTGFANKDPLQASNGEFTVTSRDSNGNIVSYIKLKSNGEIEISGLNATIKNDLTVEGNINTIGGNITADGDVFGEVLNGSNDVIGNSKSFAGHWHDQPNDSNGDQQAPTSLPISNPV